MSGKTCKFYRDSVRLQIGQGIGWRGLDPFKTICDGDVRSREKPNILRRYFMGIEKDGETEGFWRHSPENQMLEED